MKTQRDVASFVLRMTQDLWRDSDGTPNVQWRGRIEHVQSHDGVSFSDFADAVAFIQRHTAKVTQDAVSDDSPKRQDQAMHESLMLWQRFAQGYSTMLSESVQQAVRQGDALKSSMDESVRSMLRAWRLPGGAASRTGQLDDAALQALSEKLEALAVRLEALESAASRIEQAIQAGPPAAKRRPKARSNTNES